MFIGFPDSKVHIPKIRQIDQWIQLKTITPEILAMPLSINFDIQWGACLEWFPFYRHNIQIFFFFIDCSFKEEVLAIQSASPPVSIPERKPRRNDWYKDFEHLWKWNRDSLPLWRWFCIKTLIVARIELPRYIPVENLETELYLFSEVSYIFAIWMISFLLPLKTKFRLRFLGRLYYILNKTERGNNLNC